MEKLSVGLIGFGLAGEVFHAPLIQSTESLQLTKVRTSQKEKVKQSLGNRVEAVLETSEILDDPSIDLVVIATPNSSHYELAKAALLAGKHVVVDKPFVVRSEQGEELIRLSKEKNKILSVFHNRRWDNDFLTMRHLIQTNELGDIHTYYAHFDRFRPEVQARWKEQDPEGAGVLYDLGSHLIDQALILFGKPEAGYADIFTQRKEAVAPDGFHLTLYYPNERKVILRSGSLSLQPGPRYEVHGTQGSFVQYGIDGQEDALKAGSRPGMNGWGAATESQHGTVVTLENGMKKTELLPGSYESYYQGIAAAISENVTLPVSAEEGLCVIQIIELAMKSHREKRVISLS
ncbi:oxidoreductase [Risungbinella massiliensis]|uniref:oxidoreductase n=1 Tax=Risungbinella massiliensis TaxID=1329796 RepID=UPI000ABAFF57|nr:oxidoreductase [Risungbinella massiliensis]